MGGLIKGVGEHHGQRPEATAANSRPRLTTNEKSGLQPSLPAFLHSGLETRAAGPLGLGRLNCFLYNTAPRLLGLPNWKRSTLYLKTGQFHLTLTPKTRNDCRRATIDVGAIQQCSIFSNSLCPSHFRLHRTLSGLHTRTRRYLVVSRLQTVYHASTTTQRPMTFISRWTRRTLWKT